MPYCQKCGAQLDENAKYCPSCGRPVDFSERRIEGEERRSGGVRIVLLVFGGIILLVAFGFLLGGGALLWVNTSLTDGGGFITTKGSQLERDSYAIVFQHININVGELAGGWGVWRPSASDFVTIKITGSSNDPSKNVFIGIAKESDVATYLGNVNYDEVTRFSVSSSGSIALEYTPHSGHVVPSNPASQTFWAVSKHGTGTQTLEWEPETGNYWIVLMNEDGFAGVDLTISVGAKIPLLFTIGLALFACGAVALIIGGITIYFGVRR